jgi:hypothetical protein
VALKLLFKRALKASFTSLRTKSKELVLVFCTEINPLFDTRKIYCRLNVPPFCNFIMKIFQNQMKYCWYQNCQKLKIWFSVF